MRALTATRAVCLAGAVALAVSVPAGAAAIRWARNFNEARQTSRKNRKPLLVEFYADWCGPCKMMQNTTFKDSKVVETSSKFVLVRVNTDKEPRLAQQYGATSIPHAVILSPSGRVISQATGYKDAPAFRLFMLQGLP